MTTRQFNKKKFWDEVSVIKHEYSIKIPKKPHNRSAKRIAILISTAFLSANGSVHWVQCLESALYRQCKAKKLDCDRLEIEDTTHPYTCRRKGARVGPHRNYGKKLYSTEFDEWAICTTDTNNPKAELFANILTDYLTLEEHYDEQELPGSGERERDASNSRHQERFAKTAQEARFAARESVKDQQDLHCH